MFDGLKDKLDSFTQEAEDDVEVEESDGVSADMEEIFGEPVDEEPTEEDAPPVEADEHTEPDQTGETGAAEPVEDADTVSADSAQDDQARSSDPAQDAQVKSDDQVQDSQVTLTEAAQTDDQPVDEDEPESEQEDSSRGLTERAKLFATGKTVIDEDDLEAHLEELEFGLLASDVEMEVAQEILDGVEKNLVGETRRRLSSTGNIVRDALREALYDVISVGQFDFEQVVQNTEKPVVIIFTGVNGVGKTTSIAKLAHYFEQRGLSSVLANGDTYRAGANEQLEQHAKNLDKKIISHEQGSDPAAVIYDAVEYADANDVDVVLGDTAGRLHTSDGLMDQLSKIDRVIGPDMTLFVDEAVAGQDAVNRASEFDDASEIDGTVLTKADADPQGGAAISISYVTGKPILFLGTGQEYDDLERFDPEQIVDDLLGTE